MNSEIPTICVHGLGYIGLPTAATLANTGYKVAGFDTDTEYRSHLKQGDPDIDEPDLDRFVRRALGNGLTVVGEPEPAEFHLICVPTPYDRNLDRIDLTYVEDAAVAIANVLRPGDTVIMCSTVPPGTTEGRVRDLVERSGHSVDEDVLLGHTPETVLPGNTLKELRENDRLVGTVAGRDPAPIVALYDSFVTGEIRTTDATTAEFVKLIQNAYRDVNIAFANEVAKLAHEFCIDSRKAIDLANEHPRVDVLNPGPGVGGHCLPVDPLFLNHGNDVPMLIEAARRLNDSMAAFVVDLLTSRMDDSTDASVALLGVAYKGGVSDVRESPALSIRDRLVDEGVGDIRLSDPYVNQSDIDADIHSIEAAIEGADAAVLVTDHPEYAAISPSLFAERMNGHLVVDTRAMIDEERWRRHGFETDVL